MGLQPLVMTLLSAELEPRRTVRLARKVQIAQLSGGTDCGHHSGEDGRDASCYERFQTAGCWGGRGGAENGTKKRGLTNVGYFFFNLIKSIEELFLEIKDETYSSHSLDALYWFTGQLDLSGCLCKTRPKLKGKQRIGLETWTFVPGPPHSGPADLLCLPCLLPRVQGLSKKT